MNFDGREALKLARALAFPRAVGTPGEKAAASFIVEKLGAVGLQPRREEFLIPLAPWKLMKGFALTSLLVLIASRFIAFWAPWISGLLVSAMVVILAFYSSIWLKLAHSNYFLSPLFSREKKPLFSWNIVADLPAPEKSPTDLYLVAHYDSKGQNLSLPLRVFFLLLAGLASLRLALGYWWMTGRELLPFPSFAVDFPLALALAGITFIIFIKNNNRSPGALDNAGSVGILLHLAEVLMKERAAFPRVTFLFTGAEELGLQGAFAYLREHRQDLDREKSCFINLDGIGVTGKTRIFSRKGLLSPGARSSCAASLEETARRFNFLPRSFQFGFMMDHQAFLQGGYGAFTLACPSKKILAVHTGADTADQLEAQGLEEVGRFLLALIQKNGLSAGD